MKCPRTLAFTVIISIPNKPTKTIVAQMSHVPAHLPINHPRFIGSYISIYIDINILKVFNDALFLKCTLPNIFTPLTSNYSTTSHIIPTKSVEKSHGNIHSLTTQHVHQTYPFVRPANERSVGSRRDIQPYKTLIRPLLFHNKRPRQPTQLCQFQVNESHPQVRT